GRGSLAPLSPRHGSLQGGIHVAGRRRHYTSAKRDRQHRRGAPHGATRLISTPAFSGRTSVRSPRRKVTPVSAMPTTTASSMRPPRATVRPSITAIFRSGEIRTLCRRGADLVPGAPAGLAVSSAAADGGRVGSGSPAWAATAVLAAPTTR